MSNSRPEVSIIMPVYNGYKYIHSAIESVITQTFDNWELIIINDGSIDQTEKVVLGFNDDRIIYYKQSNKGVSAARNVGLARMRGDYFCFLDADDALPVNSLSSRLEIFKSDDKIEFVDGLVTSLEKNKVIFKPSFRGNPRNDLIQNTGNSFFGPTWMIKNVGKQYCFKERLTHGEDLLFYISIAYSGKYDYTKDQIYKYRSSNNSAMSDLKGLEKGYTEIYKELKKDQTISKILSEYFKRKTKSIMVKSYLANFQFSDAIRLLLNGRF